jgi:hypothetical protein
MAVHGNGSWHTAWQMAVHGRWQHMADGSWQHMADGSWQHVHPLKGGPDSGHCHLLNIRGQAHKVRVLAAGLPNNAGVAVAVAVAVAVVQWQWCSGSGSGCSGCSGEKNGGNWVSIEGVTSILWQWRGCSGSGSGSGRVAVAGWQ